MFNPFRKKPEPPKTNKSTSLLMRDTLFGDQPIETWPRDASNVAKLEPWSYFIQAREALQKGEVSTAIQLWQKVTDLPGLEARHYIQAWHFLRQNGVQPPADKAKKVYGVVAEVPMKDGLDLLAAYADFSARYWNYSGAGVVWEHPNNSLDEAISLLLKIGQLVADQIGPWDKPRPPIPAAGEIRISMLTPSGLFFGQGPMNQLANDVMGKPLVGAATNLMLQMTKLPKQQ